MQNTARTKPGSSVWAPRLAIGSRVAAAVFGGYGLASLASIALAALMPGGRADGVLGAIQVSFAIYAAAVLWVFSARTAARAWVGLLVPAVLLGAFASIHLSAAG